MKPILFNTEMVRAILDGRKTVTRRVVKTQHKDACGFYVTTRKSDGAFMGVYEYDENESMFDNPLKPPYEVNDILYVRETWQLAYTLDDNDHAIEGTERYIYAASPEDMPNFTHWVDTNGEYRDFVPWRPSIHMPKEAARIFLKVTGVRVERLQDMKKEDCEREGLEDFCKRCAELFGTCDCCANEGGIIEYFKNLWDSTIKKDQLQYYGWDANPYVWVIEFEVIDKAAALKEA